MKITKTASGAKKITMTKGEWLGIGKKAGWIGNVKTADNFKSKEFGRIDGLPDDRYPKDIGDRLLKELTPRTEYDNTHVICGVTNQNKDFVKFPEEVIRENFMFDNDADFRYACDDLYQSGASYIAAVHGGNPKMRQSKQRDDVGKSKPTKKSPKYYSYAHNPKEGLENGSFVVERDDGKFAQYNLGDFLGYMDHVPDNMALVDPALAKKLIPRSVWGN